MRNSVVADNTEAVQRRRKQHRSTATRIAADVVLVWWTRMKFGPVEIAAGQPRLSVEVEAAVVTSGQIVKSEQGERFPLPSPRGRISTCYSAA